MGIPKSSKEMIALGAVILLSLVNATYALEFWVTWMFLTTDNLKERAHTNKTQSKGGRVLHIKCVSGLHALWTDWKHNITLETLGVDQPTCIFGTLNGPFQNVLSCHAVGASSTHFPMFFRW
jgi:hypothetical protein